MSTSFTSRRRRFAALLALFGVLTLSSGAALLATVSPAQAAPSTPSAPRLTVKVCHANAGNSDANPYDYELLSIADSLVHSLFHRTGGLAMKTWSSAGTWNNIWHNAGDPRPDFVFPLDPYFTEAWCEAPTYAPLDLAPAFTDPGCENGNEGSYQTPGGNATWTVESGSTNAGATLVLKATADEGYRFPGNQVSKTFEHTFGAAQDCTEYDATAEIVWTEPNCENGNTPGWAAEGDAFVTYEVTEGTVAPGETVTVTATAVEGHAFANESKTKVFEHTFDPAEICDIVLPPVEVTPAAPRFVEPTCDNDPEVLLPASVEDEETDARRTVGIADIDGVRYELTGDLAPGGAVEVAASALPGFVIADGATVLWTHTFAMPEGCTVVAPPSVDPPAVVPTVVSAGVTDLGAAVDPRSAQGVALLVVGMVMLVLAGGLGLTPGRARRH